MNEEVYRADEYFKNAIVGYLQRFRCGSGNALPAPEIALRVGIRDADGVKTRALISSLRREHVAHIGSNNNGFFWIETEGEYREQIRSQEERTKDQAILTEAIKENFRKWLAEKSLPGGQGSMFTAER